MAINGSGMIDAKELCSYLREHHCPVSDEEVQAVIKDLDYHGNGQIDWSEFLSATIDVEKFLTEQKLRAIFHQFDTSGTGKISPDDLQFAF